MRSQQALVQVIQEPFINRVSDRKTEKPAKSLGIEALSVSQVSEINKRKNEQVQAFNGPPWQEVYPVLWVDAGYEKIRMNGHGVSTAVLIVTGINCSGIREILAVGPMHEESKETCSLIFNSPKQSRLKKVRLVVSDAHAGLKAAVIKCFLEFSWRRCKVHFMRNIVANMLGTRTKPG